MLSRFVRSIFGSRATEPASAQHLSSRPSFGKRDDTKAGLRDIISIPSQPLRTYFENRYRNEVADRDAAAAETQAALSAAFVGDTLSLTVALLMRAPLMTMWNNSENSNGTRRLAVAFSGAVDMGRRTIVAQHGTAFPVPDDQLVQVLKALGVLVAQGQTDLHWGYGIWLEPIIKEASTREGQTIRRAMVEMFDSFFATNSYHHDKILALVEKLLPASGLPRSAIKQLVANDQYQARMEAVRAHVLADAGEPLDAAIAAVIDKETGLGSYAAQRDTEKHDAVRKLIDLTPEGRGQILCKLMQVIDDPQRYGIARWGELEREKGRFRYGIQFSTRLAGFGNLLAALAARKIIWPNPDDDAARFIALIPFYRNVDHKRILGMLLDVCRAHPTGKAVAAMRLLKSGGEDNRCPENWVTDIEDMLRELPATASAALTVPASSSLRGLPPIALPAFEMNRGTMTAIPKHFDNLFDARLYDLAHMDFLARLSKLHGDIQAVSGENLRAKNEMVIRLATAAGFALSPDSDVTRKSRVVSEIAANGYDVHQRFTAFAPFVQSFPEDARTIGKLAAVIATKSAPSPKWLEEARPALAGIAADQRLQMLDCLIAAPSPTSVNTSGEVCLRALIYLSSDLDPAIVGPKLADYALKKCYLTLPGIGIRSEKLGNACLWTLAALPQGAGVPYLARVLSRTKYPKIRAKIDAKLNEAAQAAGLSRAVLDEVTVPTHDLDFAGTLKTPLSGGEAVLRVVGAREVDIEWMNEAGQPLKAPSVAMKADKEALKAVREAAKEIEADLGTQVVRLQQLYLQDRLWSSVEWRERYLDHPLVRTMARRLIWWVERPDQPAAAGLANVAGDSLCDVGGQILDLEGAKIRLWHPIDATVADVEAWRDRLEDQQITQPFAQAWREVYALTDAERTTGTYTNRWAAHILKQHQAMTLARLNGWRVTHRMWVDAANDDPWHLTIPAHGLVADYWVEGAGGDSPDVSESGAYTYVSTDRVQFHTVAPGAADTARGPTRGLAVPLTDIPPLVFSEVMRQTDLFTAVASIAADPNWLDRGEDAAHPNQWARNAAAYWTQTNTADLEESGKRRRAMLERIIPRLKMAGKLVLEDRYMLVSGTRHKYRIHLGSGASFRGERHICIVPSSARTGEKIWLPFEGDRTLSIIISKALLLAADDKITDPVILAQL